MDEGLTNIDFSGTDFSSSLANTNFATGDDSYWGDFWGGMKNVLSSDITKNLLNFGSGLYGLYEADKMKDMAKDAYKASDPFGQYRSVYGNQLLALMANPESVKDLPGYQFQFDQGAEAVQRKLGSKGYGGSGNMGVALTEYGQNFASGYFDKEATRLATLAGANISPNFNAAISGYGSGIDTASSALASLGYASVYAGGASQGTPGSTPPRPNSAGGEAAKTAGLAGSALKLGGSLANLAGATETGDTLKGAGKTLGSAAQIYTGLEQGGVGGYAKAAGGAASLAGYEVPGLAYIGAAEKIAKGDTVAGIYDAAVTYAGPVAQIFNAVASFANKGKDKREAVTSAWWDQFSKATQIKQVGRPQLQLYQLPDGTVVQGGGEAYKDIGRALLAKDESAYTSAVSNWLTVNRQDPARVSKLVPGGKLPYPVPGG